MPFLAMEALERLRRASAEAAEDTVDSAGSGSNSTFGSTTIMSDTGTSVPDNDMKEALMQQLSKLPRKFDLT